MAYRPLDPFQQYRDSLGNILSDGSFTFYEAGSLDLATVYTDPDLSVECDNPLGVDSAGRIDTEVWSDIALDVVMKNSLGVVQKSVDDIQAPTDNASALPTGDDGQFLSLVGATPTFVDVRQVPDPTGSDGRYLGVAGGVETWLDFPETVDYDADNLPGGIEQGAFSWRIGNLLFQVGSDTAPTAGTITTSKAVTFATAYDSTPIYFGISVAVQGVTGDTPSAHVSHSYAGLTTTGATAHFFAGAENNGGNTNITSTIAFKYLVIGIKAP